MSFESYMSRIACDVENISSSDKENEQICKELSLFWSDGDESKLSPKAKEVWHEWKKENKRQGKSNVEEISDF